MTTGKVVMSGIEPANTPLESGEKPTGTPIPEGTLVDASDRNLGNADDEDEFVGAGSPVPPPPPTAAVSGSAMPQGEEPGLVQLLDPVHLEPGELVPGTRYRIVRWLGTGSTGVVYEGAHVDIERRVALKVLRADKELSVDAAATFRREARTASGIGSPHIIEVVDFAQLPDGRLMFAMELLESFALSKLVKKAPVPPERLVAILRQICKGLHAAHQKGVVHRDIKPDNVMLAKKDGRDDMVKIVDFGISSLLASGQAIETAPAGTPFYMAPEQIDGHSYDGRVDLYALGCTAYALAAGRPPFVARTIEDVFTAHLEQTPTPLNERAPDAGVPPALEAVIMRLLEKNPEKRFATAADAEAAICEAQIQAGIRTAWDDLPLPDVDEETRASLDKRMPSPLRPAGRRWLWPAIAAASLLIGGGIAAAVLGGDDPSAQVRTAVDELEEQARAAASKVYFVYPPASDREYPTAYKKVLEMEAIEGALAEVAAKRAADLRREFASTLVRLGDEYWERDGGQPFAMDYYAQALVFQSDTGRARERTYLTVGQVADLARRAAEGEFTDTELGAGGVLRALAESDETARREQLEEAIALAPEMSTGVNESLEKVARGLGVENPKPRNDRPSDPEPESETGAEGDPEPELAEEDGGETGAPDVEPGPAKTSRGDKSTTSGANEEPKFKRNPELAKQLTAEGNAARKAGRAAEARKLFERAIGADRRYAPALYGRANVAFDAANYPLAAEFGRKAVKAAPNNSSYRIFLGDILKKVLKYKEAHAQYEKALELGNAKAQGRIDKIKDKVGN